MLQEKRERRIDTDPHLLKFQRVAGLCCAIFAIPSAGIACRIPFAMQGNGIRKYRMNTVGSRRAAVKQHRKKCLNHRNGILPFCQKQQATSLFCRRSPDFPKLNYSARCINFHPRKKSNRFSPHNEPKRKGPTPRAFSFWWTLRFGSMTFRTSSEKSGHL